MIKKRILSFGLICVFMCGIMSNVPVYAADNSIDTAAELIRFAEDVNSGESFAGEEVELTADIELSEDWIPIGTNDNPFMGVFNGNGFTVSGISINTPEEDCKGLFGVISGATVYNVRVKDGNIEARDYAGGVVGYAKENSIISSCHNDGVSVTTVNRSGGIVGWTDNSDVYNCSSNGSSTSNRCSGGIVGDVYSNGKIYNCFNEGYVDGNELVGGITGGSTNADIQNCINVGIINNGYLIAGGGGSRTITNSFALQNDTENAGLSVGSGNETVKTFDSTAAVLSEPVVYNGQSYSTALDALNAWVANQTDDIYYSPWVQTSKYPYLRDGVISAVKTSYGSETSQWSNSDLEEAYEKNLVPEALVGEDLTEIVSRAEFAAIAVQLYKALTGADVTTTGAKSFNDISGNLFENEILMASALDIAQGTSDTTYEPNLKINREQLATMLCRTIKKYTFDGWTYERDGEYYLDTSGVTLFSDDAEISDWAKPSVYYMAKLGVVNGVDDSHFAPRNLTTEEEASNYADATREQALVMSLRITKISDLYN